MRILINSGIDTMQQTYRTDIDGLRALSIVLVVAYHAFPEAIPGGFIGVDIFFVISGYLISGIIQRGILERSFSFRDFYARRVRRIFPALLTVLLVCLLYGWFQLFPIEYRGLGKHIAAGMAFFENFALLKEAGYFDVKAELKPLMHLWSLSIEEQFYLIFPIFIWLCHRQRLSFTIPIGVLLTISLTLNIQITDSNPNRAYLLPYTRFWELMAGALLSSVAYQNISVPTGFHRMFSALWQDRRIARALAPLTGLALIFSAALILSENTDFPGWGALGPVLGALFIIAAGMDAWMNKNVLSSKFLVKVGLISYPLYLWHWPILSLLRIEYGAEPGQALKAAGIGAAAVLAWLTYSWIEKPIRSRAIDRTTLASLTCFGAVLFAAGTVIAGNKGFPDRYHNLIPELIETKHKFPKEWRFGKCLLKKEQTFRDFDPNCFGQAAAENRQAQTGRYLIWGDSYAAHLYPGLSFIAESSAPILQLTSVACPPIVGLTLKDFPHCKETNDAILEYIKMNTDLTVVIAANWGGGKQAMDGFSPEQTLAILKSIGVRRIILFGPMPYWPQGLPTQMLSVFEENPSAPLPDRLNQGLSKGIINYDNRLAAIAQGLDISYVSPAKILCNAKGCVARINHSLTSLDYGHLTVAGARLLFAPLRELFRNQIPKLG